MKRYLIAGYVTVALSIVGWLAFWIVAAHAHSWYDASCCSDHDCYPVPATDVIETETGWKHLPTGKEFRKDQVKPSRDRNFHVCIGASGTPYCIYILQGA